MFLVVGFPGPHPPYDPTPEMAEKYMEKDIPVPDVSDEETADPVGPWVAKRHHDVDVAHDSVACKLDPTQDELRRMRAYYSGASYLTMVRSHTHRLAQFRGSDEGQLFDLTSEAGETRNLWDDPASAEIRQSLLQRTLELHIESTVHTRNARRPIVSPASAESMQ